MRQKISILGCGWLGMPLALTLVNKGFTVNGSTTSKNKFNKLKREGVLPYLIELDNLESNICEFLDAEILIITVPSKNIDNFKNLITKIKKSNIKKVLFISSSSVYPNLNQLATEETTVKKSPLSEIEILFKLNTIFKSTILRFSGLFGYDRKPGEFIKNNKKIEKPEGYVNLIHRDDCIKIIELIIKRNTWNEILNACADTHPKSRDFYTKECLKLGKNVPIFNENSLNNYKIVSTEKLKLLLDFKFKYSDLMKY